MSGYKTMGIFSSYRQGTARQMTCRYLQHAFIRAMINRHIYFNFGISTYAIIPVFVISRI